MCSKGQTPKPASFSELTLVEFAFGIVQMVHLPRNNRDSKVMYYIPGDMMAYAIYYPWQSARNFSGCGMVGC